MSLRRREYLAESRYDLDDALDALHPMLSDWVYRNDISAKKELFTVYNKLTAGQKQALASEVSKVFKKYHGDSVAVFYRRMKPGQSPNKVGGLSLSAKIDNSGTRHAKFKVRDSDVLLHFGIPDIALNSKAFGHEQEVILFPKSKPEFMGWVEVEK